MAVQYGRKTNAATLCEPAYCNKKGDYAMHTLLEAKEVTKIYGKSGHPGLNKVSFRVAEGE